MVNTKTIEEKYLQQVYGELSQSKELLEALLDQTRAVGVSALQSMNGEVSLNFDSMLDNLDTFAMIETKNREIDQLNIKMQTADKELEKVKRLMQRPYFGKVTADFLEDEEPEDFYIGINGYRNVAGADRIYDWRSPIAELFYNNELGASSYWVNARGIPVNINNRRQFIIEENRLLSCFDTSVAVQDDVLLQALEEDSTKLMKDITATIQKEQNAIIRDQKNPAILVNGVAGSGKTSTIMQRIAYLLYSLRQEITADNILILSPNNRFIAFISNVLPSLGEKNPLNLTLSQFVQQYLEAELESEEEYFHRISQPEVEEQTKVLRSKAFCHFIHHSDELLLGREPFFKDIRQKGKVIISQATLRKLYQKTPDYSHYQEKIRAVKGQLESYWERRIIRQARSVETQNQILSLSEKVQMKYFHELIQDDSEESVFHYGQKLLQKKYQSVTKAIDEMTWIDLEGIFQFLYQEFTGKTYQGLGEEKTLDEAVILLTIKQQLVEKIPVPKLRFLLIDEIQDYNEAQISLILSLYPRTEYTMVGDENQAIFNSRIAFTEIAELFQAAHISLKQYELINSYRSSGAITKTFGPLIPAASAMNIVPVRPDGEPTVYFSYADLAEYATKITDICQRLQQKKLTIITKTLQEAVDLKQQLNTQTRLLEENSIDIFPISLAKGLEFDHVLVHDASQENYSSQRDRRILYTMISRGMQTLYISYRGELTDFLVSSFMS